MELIAIPLHLPSVPFVVPQPHLQLRKKNIIFHLLDHPPQAPGGFLGFLIIAKLWLLALS